MLIRCHHQLRAYRRRRLHCDTYEPAVVIGPVFLRFPAVGDWRQGDLVPRRKINGRWLPGIKASHVQYISTVGHRGSRRGDRGLNMQQKAAERCALFRYTSMPF